MARSTTPTRTRPDAFKSSPQMRAMAAAVRGKVPVLLWGPPGVGKSAKITAYGNTWRLHVETVVGSVREPSDYLGLPMEVEGRVVYSPPAWAVACNEATGHGYDGALLFLDELTTSSPSVQKANLRLLQERFAGDLPLADHVAMIAAANPPEQAADGWDLPAPVANRLMHLEWFFDPDEWFDGVLTGFADTRTYSLDELTRPGDAADQARVNGLVSGFLRANPILLNPGPPRDEAKAGRAWASPRSWTNVMRVLAHLDPADAGAIHLAVAGLVGEGPAREFIAWSSSADLPDPAEVIADPTVVEWDRERPDRLFVITTGVAAYALMRLAGGASDAEDRGVSTWKGAIKALTMCAEANRADVAMPGARVLLDRVPAGVRLPERARHAFADLYQRTGRWAAQVEPSAA
jgi:hypothetical protein